MWPMDTCRLGSCRSTSRWMVVARWWQSLAQSCSWCVVTFSVDKWCVWHTASTHVCPQQDGAVDAAASLGSRKMICCFGDARWHHRSIGVYGAVPQSTRTLSLVLHVSETVTRNDRGGLRESLVLGDPLTAPWLSCAHARTHTHLTTSVTRSGGGSLLLPWTRHDLTYFTRTRTTESYGALTTITTIDHSNRQATVTICRNLFGRPHVLWIVMNNIESMCWPFLF